MKNKVEFPPHPQIVNVWPRLWGAHLNGQLEGEKEEEGKGNGKEEEKEPHSDATRPSKGALGWVMRTHA